MKVDKATYTASKETAAGQLDHAVLTDFDNEKLYELTFGVPREAILAFEVRYEAWTATWADPALQLHSNPRMFARSREYDELIAYCRLKGKTVWPLLFRKFAEGDELATNAIEDLTFPEYADEMDQVLAANQIQVRETEGIIPSQAANWTRYIARVVARLYDDYQDEER